MSETAVPTPSSRPAGEVGRSIPARAMAAFSGTTGYVTKLVLLAIFNGVVVWAIGILVSQEKWIPAVVAAAATIGIDWIYLSRGRAPAKFLIPGVIFLICFTIIPILYTVNIAFTNYSTGHILTKDQAVESIKENSLSPPPNGLTYTLTPALDKSKALVLLLVDDATGKTYLGTRDGLQPLAGAKKSEGAIVAAPGFTPIRGAKLFALDTQLNDFRVPIPGGSAIHPEGIDNAVQLKPTLRYDPKADTFTRLRDGTVYRDNGKGSFAVDREHQLEPGWKTYVGFSQFGKLFTNPLYRDPFVRVLIWTIAFAFLTVGGSFFLGLFLAITLQKKIRFQRFYRTVLVIPYAIPSFLTLLVWAGLLNDDFGVVNHLLHIHVPWLFDVWWARVSVILVSMWLTFPYFFLVSLGALQSIPGELVEAAKVDGAGGWQVFRKVTFPLLMVAVAPLLIASFAFNFNNFNNIFLLTKGGPPYGSNGAAGATDILISYTYNLAFSAGKGAQYATAAAVSIIIFFIVATISGVAFWKSRTLESLR